MKSKTLFCLVVLTLFTSLIPAVHAQTYSVIHSFNGGAGGSHPSTGVTIRGNTLYGTTYNNCGIVYQLTNTGSDWLFSTLATLSNDCEPLSRVVFGPDGHLYGTSTLGGTYIYGTVFKLTPQVGPCNNAACYWTLNDLHDFGSGTDGRVPGAGDLIWDQQGNIYGTTGFGGTSRNCQNGCGTVYELTPSGNGYTENVIYSFSGPDGAYPNGLVFDNKGNLFGTTGVGGANDDGTVFELNYVVGVGWTEHVLYSFQNPTYGIYGPIFDSAGNLYGTTIGICCTNGGTVFELSPSGDSWVFTTLLSLPAGDSPYAGVVVGPDGALYGTFTHAAAGGSVFKLTKTQNGWQYTSLHDSEDDPESPVTFDTQGNLYGTTVNGGMYGAGTVWMIKP